MKKFGIINHPGFYKFLRRKMRHRTKIRDKERMGYRGPKQRYSVWRAEYNQKWKPFEIEETHGEITLQRPEHLTEERCKLHREQERHGSSSQAEQQ